ncbi:hypothetical protein FHY55_19795 [Oceanicola sp. D3]|uniref:hypothetical protein n=1 Tax=Oceanicola sp. D3 TaxID=2587163 RepID=UPI00111E3AB3|nr:hypothetical protein [Oceanicola sp. D3]QDC11337.1 hypothetical protein FHY55_19795 [Oceanicola sp. D3]
MADKPALPDHFCPGCGAPQKVFLRYPWYFCRDCVKTATDGEGRTIVTGNTALYGGFGWRYADEDSDAVRECSGVIALIARRSVYIHEARFGGVVAEPMFSMAHPDRARVWRIDGRFPVEPTGYKPRAPRGRTAETKPAPKPEPRGRKR